MCFSPEKYVPIIAYYGARLRHLDPEAQPRVVGTPKTLAQRAGDAGALEAVASTGGQIMPPIMGAAAFLMAELLELSYTDVVLAALIPAVLFYYAVFVQADLEAAKHGVDAVPAAQIP